VVLEGHVVPVALGTGDDASELVELLVAGDALELLLGEQGVLLVLLVLGDDQDDLLDLGLEEEQGLLDLQLVTLEVDLVVDLRHLLVHLQPVLVVVVLAHPRLQLRLHLLQTREDLSLQGLELLLQLGDVVLLDDVGQVVDVAHLVLEAPLVERHAILEGIEFGPEFDHFWLYLVDLVLDALRVVLLVELSPLLRPRTVQHLQVLLYFPELDLEVLYLFRPLLKYALEVAQHYALGCRRTQVLCVPILLLD